MTSHSSRHQTTRSSIFFAHYPTDTTTPPHSEQVLVVSSLFASLLARLTDSTMKFTAIAVTALVAVANVASATDYQPALRALAAPEPAAPEADTMSAGPTEQQPAPVEAAAAADKEPTANIDADSKKPKEWWGGSRWGRRWGRFGRGRPWSGYGGGWGGYGGGWGW